MSKKKKNVKEKKNLKKTINEYKEYFKPKEESSLGTIDPSSVYQTPGVRLGVVNGIYSSLADFAIRVDNTKQLVEKFNETMFGEKDELIRLLKEMHKEIQVTENDTCHLSAVSSRYCTPGGQAETMRNELRELSNDTGKVLIICNQIILALLRAKYDPDAKIAYFIEFAYKKISAWVNTSTTMIYKIATICVKNGSVEDITLTVTESNNPDIKHIKEYSEEV